jgi:hypothetical protein
MKAKSVACALECMKFIRELLRQVKLMERLTCRSRSAILKFCSVACGLPSDSSALLFNH